VEEEDRGHHCPKTDRSAIEEEKEGRNEHCNTFLISKAYFFQKISKYQQWTCKITLKHTDNMDVYFHWNTNTFWNHKVP